MIIFGIMVFGLMLAIGGLFFDLMRYEAHRARLQATLDRAVLAAACLSQTLDTKSVVLDYFAKAGMSDYTDASDITVTKAFNFRKVQASARIHLPLNHGTFAAFTGETADSNVLIAQANGTAEESIGDVEISLLLDVSGSMAGTRLSNLKAAARDFLGAVYDVAGTGALTPSIIPYASQVNATAGLLSCLFRSDSHEN